MQGDMGLSQERAVMALMAKVTAIMDLGELLDVAVKELPEVLGALGCWIYLHPDYVPEYSGFVKRGEREISETDLTQIFDDFIVLAATNLESKKALVGKAYFGAGEGITGWVYKYGKPLRISNVADDQELKKISPDLYWANEYHDGDELYEPGDKIRLLAVPLILSEEPIGILKFHATRNKQPFSEIAQDIAVIVSQIISGALRQTWIAAEQNRAITRLIETSNKKTPIDVIIDVTNSMKEMLSCSRTECFLRSEDGTSIRLVARNGMQTSHSETVAFNRGYSLLGWVFKTGLPLTISDIRQFINNKFLTDELLERISNTRDINDEDRYLKCEEINYYGGTSKLSTTALLAVPIKSKDQETLGVLSAYWSSAIKARHSYEISNFMIASSFASTIALSLENERQKLLGELLTELGNLEQVDELFKLVTESIPRLVSSTGCSIFKSTYIHGILSLRLASTSRKDIRLEDGKVPEIVYKLGEGKTGMCGQYRSALVANHFGAGRVSVDKLEQEHARINAQYPNDLVDVLYDTNGNKAGLFHLQTQEKLPLGKRMDVHKFSKTITITSNGIISQKMGGGTWSFAAVPIHSNEKLLGVITLARPVPTMPLLMGDISLLRSIAGRLASVMNNLRIMEQRKQLVMSLAHEINTPLTGIIADSENIYNESKPNSDLFKLAKHNLEQVLRLHMQAATIMSVLSEQAPRRKFSEHSIYRPIKEACELFESEAASKGCDILGPRAREGNFPDIEMSLFDLTIAFKNIIHNAVKYSFNPPVNLAIHRTIKVWGEWDKTRKGYYVIHVQNYGVGITSEEIEKRLIFDSYYRGEKASDRKRTGSGLGLAHARLIIEELHHGYIDVSSEPQGGDAYLTQFSISLPIKQPKHI